jgi:hypothetical protein
MKGVEGKFFEYECNSDNFCGAWLFQNVNNFTVNHAGA